MFSRLTREALGRDLKTLMDAKTGVGLGSTFAVGKVCWLHLVVGCYAATAAAAQRRREPRWATSMSSNNSNDHIQTLCRKRSLQVCAFLVPLHFAVSLPLGAPVGLTCSTHSSAFFFSALPFPA